MDVSSLVESLDQVVREEVVEIATPGIPVAAPSPAGPIEPTPDDYKCETLDAMMEVALKNAARARDLVNNFVGMLKRAPSEQSKRYPEWRAAVEKFANDSAEATAESSPLHPMNAVNVEKVVQAAAFRANLARKLLPGQTPCGCSVCLAIAAADLSEAMPLPPAPSAL
jgi:hypothetical protein